MKRTLIVAGLGLVTIALLAGFTWSHARGPMDPKRMERFINWRVNDAMDEIQASPNQRNTVLAVKDRLLPEAQRMMGERGAIHEQFAQAWKSEKPDGKALHSALDQRMDEFRAFAHKALDGALEIHAVLTPAQREQLAAQAAEHAGMMPHP
jgi:Spy/CpxP family protein refolding chaperone